MAHGRDHWDLGFIDRPRHNLLIERPEILHGAAAAAGDDKVGDLPAICVAYRPGDLGGRLFSLDTDRKDEHSAQRPALSQDPDDILYGGAGAGRDHRDALRH